MLLLLGFLLGILTSCSTTYVASLPKDDVYYSSKDYYQPVQQEQQISYDSNTYYDYEYTAKIRRFHSPVFYSSYYSDYYTDLYWYTYDPFYYGTSIYVTYNWLWPSYGGFYYGYTSPYWYYNPYYLGNVYWGFGYNYGYYPYYYYPYHNHFWGHNNYWNHNLNNVYYGPRNHHMSTTNNGRDIRPPRTPQGGKSGNFGDKSMNIKRNDQRNDSKPVDKKYTTPTQRSQKPANSDVKPQQTPRTYSSPQYTRPRSSQEYISPKTDNIRLNPPPTRSEQPRSQPSTPRYNQERSQPSTPRYTPSAPSRSSSPPSSTPSRGNTGGSSGKRR